MLLVFFNVKSYVRISGFLQRTSGPKLRSLVLYLKPLMECLVGGRQVYNRLLEERESFVHLLPRLLCIFVGQWVLCSYGSRNLIGVRRCLLVVWSIVAWWFD